ncbi:hypothetical protein XPA_009742 [Xanthoria parietina]
MAAAPQAPSYDSNTGYLAQNNTAVPHPSYSNAAPPPPPQQASGNPYAQSQPVRPQNSSSQPLYA